MTSIKSAGRRGHRAQFELSHWRFLSEERRSPVMYSPQGGQLMRVDRTVPERQQIVLRTKAA